VCETFLQIQPAEYGPKGAPALCPQSFPICASDIEVNTWNKEENAMAAQAPAVAAAPAAQPAVATPTNWSPTTKVSVGVLAAALVTLLLPFWKKLTGTDLAAAEGAALTTIITFIVQYLVPERG
jgi:hypothetical protein